MMAQEQAERQQQQQQQQHQAQFSSRKVSFAPGVAVPPSSDSEGQTTDNNSTARQFNSFRANVAPPSSNGAMPPRGPSSMAANNLARDSLREMLGQMEPSQGPPRAAFSSYRNDPDFLPSSSSSSAFASRGGEIFDEDLGRSRPKRDSFYYLMQSARKKREQNSDDIKSWSSLAPF
jgi:hypothetical protein